LTPLLASYPSFIILYSTRHHSISKPLTVDLLNDIEPDRSGEDGGEGKRA
jgi:hypothetical protein